MTQLILRENKSLSINFTSLNYKDENNISNTAFQNCNSLSDIYVPWSEGIIDNAPWGANNATIHYNWSDE